MFVMQVLAPSVNRLIAVDDPGCSPVGNGVPWYVGLSDYGSLRLRRRLALIWLPRSPTENKSCDYGRSSRPSRVAGH